MKLRSSALSSTTEALMKRSIALLVATSVIVIACQKAPDRHVLWTGKGVPISGAKVVSSHESKPECEKARASIFMAVRSDENPDHFNVLVSTAGDISAYALKDGTVILVSKAGKISGFALKNGT